MHRDCFIMKLPKELQDKEKKRKRERKEEQEQKEKANSKYLRKLKKRNRELLYLATRRK